MRDVAQVTGLFERSDVANSIRCAICGKRMSRPSHLILSHRAEGIRVVALCSSMECWEEIGQRMANGKR